MTTTEPSLSEAAAAPGPGQRSTPRTGAWLPTWDLITTKNLEIRKRRGLMITMVVLIVVPTVLFYGLRLLFHAVDPHTYALAGSPGMFSGATNLMAEFGFIAAAALGAAAGTTDLTDGMFRHLVITGRSRLALYLARIPAGLAILVPLVALAFAMNCLVTSYESTPNPTTVSLLRRRPPRTISTRPGCRPGSCSTPSRTPTDPARIGPGHRPRRRSARRSTRTSRPTTATTPPPRSASSNPADNEMAKIGLWLELEVGIGFLVGLGLGSLTGQRTTTIIVLIALEIIVTPLLARTQLPYFIDGQRLVVGVAMDQLRPAALAPASAAAAAAARPRPHSVRRAGSPRHPADADLGDDLGDRRLDRRLVGHRRLADDDPRRLSRQCPDDRDVSLAPVSRELGLRASRSWPPGPDRQG